MPNTPDIQYPREQAAKVEEALATFREINAFPDARRQVVLMKKLMKSGPELKKEIRKLQETHGEDWENELYRKENEPLKIKIDHFLYTHFPEGITSVGYIDNEKNRTSVDEGRQDARETVLFCKALRGDTDVHDDEYSKELYERWSLYQARDLLSPAQKDELVRQSIQISRTWDELKPEEDIPPANQKVLHEYLEVHNQLQRARTKLGSMFPKE